MDELTAVENVELPALLAGRSPRAARRQALATEYDDAHLPPSDPVLISWQSIAAADGLLVQDEQQVLTPAAWLLCLLAIGSVAVLVGGRMAEHTRRVRLLKAVGSTPPARRDPPVRIRLTSQGTER